MLCNRLIRWRMLLLVVSNPLMIVLFPRFTPTVLHLSTLRQAYTIFEGADTMLVCIAFNNTLLDRDVSISSTVNSPSATGMTGLPSRRIAAMIFFSLSEGTDFVASFPQSTFPQGILDGSLCVSTEALNDSAVENVEQYSIEFSSSDEAVMIANDTNTVLVTIIDQTTGKYK